MDVSQAGAAVGYRGPSKTNQWPGTTALVLVYSSRRLSFYSSRGRQTNALAELMPYFAIPL